MEEAKVLAEAESIQCVIDYPVNVRVIAGEESYNGCTAVVSSLGLLNGGNRTERLQANQKTE